MIGETLGGFAIEKKLGQGGMGAVFLARSAGGERCALKLLAQDLSGDEKARARFSHECRVLEKLDHPRIVRALSGLVEEGERCFYAMELVDGEDLAKRLEKRGALPVTEATAIVSDVLEALAVAHEQGVLHRDVKPSNVFVSEDGRAKLGDFGIAFVAGATRHTRTGAAIGTPEYMAPEVARGEEPTTKTDLYAAGILLYALLEGRPPFEGSQPLAVLRKQIDEPPPALSRDVSAKLAAVVARALAKNPEERFEDASTFRAAVLTAVLPPVAPNLAGDETRETTLARAETRPVATLAALPPPRSGGGPGRGRVILVVLVLSLAGLAGLALSAASPRTPKGPSVSVVLHGGDKLEGELVKVDVAADLLVVRLANGNEQTLPLAQVSSYEKR